MSIKIDKEKAKQLEEEFDMGITQPLNAQVYILRKKVKKLTEELNNLILAVRHNAKRL